MAGSSSPPPLACLPPPFQSCTCARKPRVPSPRCPPPRPPPALALYRTARIFCTLADPSLIPEVVGRGFPGMPKSAGYAMWDAVISPHRGVQGLFTVVDNNSTWRSVRRAYGPAMGPGTMRCAGHGCTMAPPRHMHAHMPR